MSWSNSTARWRSATSHGRWPNSTPSAAGSCSALLARSDTARAPQHHRVVFRSQVALGAVGVVAAGAAVVTAADSVHRASRGTHHVVIAGLHFTYPAVNVAAALLLALAALGLFVL